MILDSDSPGPAPMIVASGKATYDVGPFEEITTTGPQDVIVTRGDAFSVRSEGSPVALGLLEAVVEDGELLIRPKGGSENFNWWRDGGRLRSTFYVTLPQLEGVSVAGSGSVKIDRIEGEEFTGTIAGPGELSIASMDVKDADFRIGGSGDVSVAGTARETRVAIGGSGEVRGGGLRSQQASVSIGGSGDVALTVEDEVDISIAGSGNVDITGPARCSVNRMGSGDVNCAAEVD